ncbi:DUF1801 domain-containing protein [Microvirga terrestris]|uniref:DUF1801 domain-containing protein n=1 Tax=Microvirga terrestris TaxID=2791024 RepID=A0ABS0HW98_9HYPH|nr:DUF1801 domain-containing protein [Microvirga terrestris]MBF9197775.1 DUF1801 domain-containing protein [Microvirga terrestris]
MTKATATMKANGASTDGTAEPSPSQQIDAHIQHLNDWRGETLARVRALILQAVPDVVEAVKWRGVPVWEKAGIICTGETYKSAVKLTFPKGASLDDPSRLFNASLDGNTRRAIDLHEGAALDEQAFKTLIQAAAALNTTKPAKRSKTASARARA